SLLLSAFFTFYLHDALPISGFFTLYIHLFILYFIDIMFLVNNEEMQQNHFSSFNYHYLYITTFIMYLILLLANTKHYSNILNSSKLKMNIMVIGTCVVLSSILNSFIIINIVFILTIIIFIFINYKDKIKERFI